MLHSWCSSGCVFTRGSAQLIEALCGSVRLCAALLSARNYDRKYHGITDCSKIMTSAGIERDRYGNRRNRSRSEQLAPGNLFRSIPARPTIIREVDQGIRIRMRIASSKHGFLLFNEIGNVGTVKTRCFWGFRTGDWLYSSVSIDEFHSQC